MIDVATAPEMKAFLLPLPDRDTALALAHFPIPPALDRSRDHAMFSLCTPDQVGIVWRVSEWFYRNSVSVEAGRAGPLSELFGAQYLISAEGDGMERLGRLLREGQFPRPSPSPGINVADEPPPVPYRLTVLAENEDGILSRTAEIMARNGVNIVTHECHTIFDPASRPGDRDHRRRPGLFNIKMEVYVPRRKDGRPPAVKAELDALRRKYGWALSFDEQLTASRLKRAISGIAGCNQGAFSR